MQVNNYYNCYFYLVIQSIGSMTLSSVGQGTFVTINCRSVRVGDYKCVMPTTIKKLFKVVFSSKGILFHLPHTTRSKLIFCTKYLKIVVFFRVPLISCYVWYREWTGGLCRASRQDFEYFRAFSPTPSCSFFEHRAQICHLDQKTAWIK